MNPMIPNHLYQRAYHALVLVSLLLPAPYALADLKADTERLNHYLDQLREERLVLAL